MRSRQVRLVLAATCVFWGAACSSDPEPDQAEGTVGQAGMGVIPPAGGISGGTTSLPSGGSTAPSSGGSGGTSPSAGSSGASGAAAAGTGGVAGSSMTAGVGAGAGGSAGAAGSTPDLSDLERFSFFVTSLRALQELSGDDQGFGGDLRYGETGEGAGLRGADKICTEIAELSMPGAGAKGWRAFLSAVAAGPGGTPVHAIDRIGEGPWYDRLGRVFANDKSELMGFRPTDTDPAIVNDFPNEDGVPNHNPDGTGEVDNHDSLTGSNSQGQVYAMDMRVTCNDWTNAVPDADDAPRVGHSWPRNPGGGFPGGGPGFPGGGGPGGDEDPGGGYGHWISSLDEAGCGPGVFLEEMGGPMEDNPTVGSGGGYGGFYCFALNP